MNQNIKILIAVVLVVCSAVLLGCKPVDKSNPEDHPKRADNHGSVHFDEIGVSLTPSAEWQQLVSGPFVEAQSICKPALKGLGENIGCLIQVFATTGNAEIKNALTVLESQIRSNPNTIIDSFMTNDFHADSGITGSRVTYEYASANPLFTNGFSVHVYLFQNKNSNCITINYIAPANNSSETVDQMIVNTLKLN